MHLARFLNQIFNKDGFILIDNRFNGTHRIYFVKLIQNYIEFCNIIETKEIMLPEICDRKELFCIIETHIYDGELIYKYGAFTVREKQIDYKNVFTQLLDYSYNREFPYMNEMSDKSCDFFIKYYRHSSKKSFANFKKKNKS